MLQLHPAPGPALFFGDLGSLMPVPRKSKRSWRMKLELTNFFEELKLGRAVPRGFYTVGGAMVFANHAGRFKGLASLTHGPGRMNQRSWEVHGVKGSKQPPAKNRS